MRICAINNYSLEDSLLSSSKKETPAHHNWGCDYLKSKGHEVVVINYKVRHEGRIKTHLRCFWFNLTHIVFFNRFDIVISFANPIIGWSAYFKILGLIKCRLFTLVHHHQRGMLLSKGYDKIFFLSKSIMNYSQKEYNSLYNRMVYLQWGADLPYYNDTYRKIFAQDKSIVLISNGKTFRDLQLITEGCKKMDLPLIIITDKVTSSCPQIITSCITGENAISYKELLSYMSQATVSIIPVKYNERKDSLCGLTSLLDALALGQPVIMSDNTNISVDIEGLKIGLIYKAGDENDFISKVKIFIDNPVFFRECSKNARKYAEEHSYDNYCKHLEKEISLS